MITNSAKFRAVSMFLGCLLLAMPATAQAAPAATAPVFIEPNLVRTVFGITLLAFVPMILICMTSFLRIVIVLGMIRHAFGMPETPPNQVLVSLALFMTIFTMGPAVQDIHQNAIQPMMTGSADLSTSFMRAAEPLKTFMLSQVRDQDLEAVYAISQTPLPATPDEVDIWKLTPAFMLNELRVAFSIGFIIMLPFLLIDLVVSSVLLSLGMMMVPPATISLPLKILLFVVIDGWTLVLQGVIGGFG